MKRYQILDEGTPGCNLTVDCYDFDENAIGSAVEFERFYLDGHRTEKPFTRISDDLIRKLSDSLEDAVAEYNKIRKEELITVEEAKIKMALSVLGK